MQTKNILFVFAHPDDESFSSAGTIAKYSKQDNIQVYIAVATKGEAGKLGDPPLTSRKNLGNYRENELIEATKILGVKDVIFMNFIDGTLDKLSSYDNQQLVQKIAKLIVDIRPEILITFPEDGISKHKDHIALHKACLQAIDLAKQIYIIPKVYYTVVPTSIYKSRGILNQGVPDNQITTIIDISDYRQLKYEALTKYKTQIFSVNKVYPNLLDKKDLNIISKSEYYMLVQKDGLEIDFIEYHEDKLL
jgi:LmbE family N-acetylglucosaminyl deacetylase